MATIKSIEEKAKAYDEIIKKANKMHHENCEACQACIEELIPELAESEHERTRKEIINYLEPQGDCCGNKERWIAWLEKQAQKPTEKVEPKFHEGDWVVFNNKHQSIYQVEKIEDGYYILRHTHGGTFRVCVLHDESLRLWTIQDAKDGDVLACNEEILLFKSYSVQGRISLYCWHNGQTNNFHNKEVVDTLLTTRNKVCPATKEQRDLLFQKMKESGYKWDADKLELRKIEQKPTEEVDLPEFESYLCLMLQKFRTKGMCTNGEIIDYVEEHSQKLRDILVRPAWSEEDEGCLENAIMYCEWARDKAPDVHCYETSEKSIKWLKSLRHQSQWKPSEEQMLAIDTAINVLGKGTLNGKQLIELQEQLKKLKGEEK